MTTIIKSQNDSRFYKHIKLSNGLKCLIIQDPENDMAAAALSVNAGGYDSPQDVPGLPHLLEHMLFFGSTTYPKENYYTEYIVQHGGSSNAFTSNDMTTYHFDIFSDHFEHALDIFSHFFKDPIFNEEMIEREVNAVDSEFYGTYNNDSQKQYQVLNTLMDNEYPVTKFICGNKKTLCVPDIYKRMLEFYYNHYSSNKMYLVVISKESIETLEKNIIDKFSTIKNVIINKNIQVFDSILPFDNFLKTSPDTPIVKIEPIQEKHQLSIYWQLPSTVQKYKIKISNFWGNILGHEGENSLYSFLKNKSYVTSLMAGNNEDDKFDLFEITMTLTNLGNKNILDITRIIRYFMEKLTKMTESQVCRIYNENKKIDHIYFNNKSKEDPQSYVLSLVNNLRNYDDELILFGKQYYQDIDKNDINEIIKYVQILYNTKPIIFHSSPFFRGTIVDQEKEKYYDTMYHVDWIPGIWVQVNVESNLEYYKMNIPAPNEYIPEDFTMIECKELQKIKKISSVPLGELWFELDTQFKQPKIKVSFTILLDKQIIENKILCNLYTDMLNDTINEKLYPAQITNNNYVIYYNDYIQIEADGYSDKIINVWSSLLDIMCDFKCNSERFNQILEKHKRNYLNYEAWNTQKQLNHHIKELYTKNVLFYQDVLKLLDKTTCQDLIEFEKHLYDKCYYIGLIQGNASIEQCNKFKEKLHIILEIKNTSVLTDNPILFKNPQLDKLIYNYEPYNKKEIDINSSTVTLYDLGDEHMNNDKNLLLNIILIMILSDSFFDKLRTQQQLGYSVDCSCIKYTFLDKNKSAIKFSIQSSAYDNDHLQSRINDFIENIFDCLSESAFDNCVSSLVTELSQSFQSLEESFYYNLRKIKDRSFNFDSKKQRLLILKELSFENLVQYVKNNIVNNKQKIVINVN